jgi:hypothetical protein
MAAWTGLVALPVVVLNSGGCNGGGPATSQPTSAEDRQTRAIKDPMNYQPDFQNTPDVSDSGGMKKDLNDVFNP